MKTTLKEKFFRECTSSIAGQDIVIKSANDLVTWFENHLKEEKEKFAENLLNQIKQEKSDSIHAKRTGDFRIGLAKAMDIIDNFTHQ